MHALTAILFILEANLDWMPNFKSRLYGFLKKRCLQILIVDVLPFGPNLGKNTKPILVVFRKAGLNRAYAKFRF